MLNVISFWWVKTGLSPIHDTNKWMCRINGVAVTMQWAVDAGVCYRQKWLLLVYAATTVRFLLMYAFVRITRRHWEAMWPLDWFPTLWVRAKDIFQRAAEPSSRRTKTSIVGWLRWKQQCHTVALCNMAALTPPPLHSHCHSPRLKRLYKGEGEKKTTQDASLLLIVGVLFPS